MTRHPPHLPPVVIAGTGTGTGAGFALLEVLICILVLAVGLIGTAMMQLHATRTSEQSNLHDTALSLAMQIADELRANDEQMRLPAGSNPFTSFDYTVPTVAVPGSPRGVSCYQQTCTAQQMAMQSLNDWRLRADQVLRAGGRIEVCRDDKLLTAPGAPPTWCDGTGSTSTGVPVAVKIAWAERDADGRTVADPSPRVVLLVSPFAK